MLGEHVETESELGFSYGGLVVECHSLEFLPLETLICRYRLND